MYLRRLELQGFKTFAQKTVLEFLPDTGGRRGLTAVVGPNGSGKSNIADAIRWVMGEQSMKLLRGKKSEDVIFSGSEKKSRAGFAEISMTLVNDDKSEIDLAEIVVTRRLYRDGQSEYEVNRQSARLTDVALLLAQAGIGQRTYSVIGQGMVDAVLVASPAERKEFFDEAAGLRPFQLKRQSSMNKLDATKDNLKQAELLLREIGPRLSSLERQAKRLQERDGIQEEVRELERTYYGGMWKDITTRLTVAQTSHKAAEDAAGSRAKEAEGLEGELSTLEKAIPRSEGFREIQTALDVLAGERSKLREEQLKLESSREVAKIRAEKPWSPLPLSKIIESIDQLKAQHDKLWTLLDAASPDIAKVKSLVEEIRSSNGDLLGKLQRPAPEPEAAAPTDPKIEKETERLMDAMHALDAKIEETKKKLDAWNKNEEAKRSHIFELQHKLSALRREATEAEHKASSAAVDVARIETRRDAFLLELRAQAPGLEAQLEELAKTAKPPEGGSYDTLLPRLTKLRSQLEWIGGIDPEVLKEYEETKKRFDDLASQTQDLTQAMGSLESIIAELDKTIKERADTSFHLLDREFGSFFKKLFGGGEAKLIEVAAEPETDEDGNILSEPDMNAGPAGIDIQATPPGKRLKGIALLSGGERALTSIALICAIMATNPSPFVVLDEVDAALDESNSRKFAEILGTLADRTQFIVVTHNRATMDQAHVLYGVTMGDDGVSQLLSVKLEDVMKAR
ncbi:MAG: AAA family ATPase [Patescibacteria group bacterium]|jgi:chromosome segregation protein